jgi:hypothetical protein
MEKLAADDGIHQGSEFVLFSKQDMIQLEDWNLDLPSYVDGCVQDQTQGFMVSHPTKQAIQAWDGTLTYSELDHLASIYTVRLRAFGVEPEATAIPNSNSTPEHQLFQVSERSISIDFSFKNGSNAFVNLFLNVLSLVQALWPARCPILSLSSLLS